MLYSSSNNSRNEQFYSQNMTENYHFGKPVSSRGIKMCEMNTFAQDRIE